MDFNSKIRRGFTLIELLIVIAIVGILAVAFLPNVLKAPSKGRDATRITDLQKIQKVILNANLSGKRYPSTSGYVADGLATGYASPENDWAGAFKLDFGGEIPMDPQTTTSLFSASGTDLGKYYYATGSDQALYSFGLYALMENIENANGQCDDAKTHGAILAAAADDSTNWCYVILVQ